MRRREFATGAAAAMAALPPRLSADSAWVRPAAPSEPLIWGRRDGIVFGLASPGGMRGPRGLIRVGILNNGQAELINFVAVEPVTFGEGTRQSRMAFSELEKSQTDGRQGKLFRAADRLGTIETLPAKPAPVERLTVRINVEKFTANHAHVYVVASMTSNRPQEVAFGVHHEEDSAPIEENTLTATMGNYARIRWLWLKDRVVDSRKHYAGYTAAGFIDKENYPFSEMLTYGDGDALVLGTTNEADPAAVKVPERPFWTYKSVKLTQYWRVPARHIQPDLRVKVNGRGYYWASQTPIPGGLAFENFEVRQRYMPGQVFVFGMTPKEPWEWRPPIPRLGERPTE